MCKKLVGHFLICDWLHMATTYMKHWANKVTTGWDNETNSASPPQEHDSRDTGQGAVGQSCER